jgi:hypothetical protein
VVTNGCVLATAAHKNAIVAVRAVIAYHRWEPTTA